MRSQKYSFGERRRIGFFQEVRSNFTVVAEAMSNDMREAFAKKDPIAIAMLPILEATRIIVDGPNALIGGILDDKMEPPNGFRTTQEAAAVIHNLNPFDFHFLRALNHTWNTATVWPLDVVQAVSGIGNGSRSAMKEILKEAA